MEVSGQIDDLVNNLRVRKRSFLAISPALVGMLPMPGGALLSSPIIKRGDGDIPNEIKVSVNVWFRHVLYLIL